MSEVLVRVVALGATAAERGGGYCALCFATRADRRLVSPRHLQRLVQQLAGYMAHLAPMASSLTWGARACAWCEARCAAACRVLHALDAAAGAHALLGMLDTGQHISGLEKQMGEAEVALGRAHGAALRCTDVLLIDTLQPVMELMKNTTPAPAPAPHPPPASQDIETVVIEDDPADRPAPTPAPPALRCWAGRSRRRPSPDAPIVPVGSTPNNTRLSRGTGGQRATGDNATGPYQSNTARKTFPASNAAQKGSPAGTSANPNNAPAPTLCSTTQNAIATLPNPLRAPSLSDVSQNASPMLVQALAGVAPPAAPAKGHGAGGAAAAPLSSDAVLMVLPPGAQIISRLDGVGPKYLLLNPPDLAPPAALSTPLAVPSTPLAAPSTPLAAPSIPPAPLPSIAAAPGSCTVFCDSDSDSSDSILLSQLIQRRDEYNQKHKHSESDKNITKTNNNTNNSFNFYNTGNSKCYITDVKSLSEEKSNSVTETSKQCFITDVKSLSEDSESSNKRNSDVTRARQSKKAKGDTYEYTEEQARAPLPSTDRVDWEDKIPMDVISFMDATDPCAGTFLPPRAAGKLFKDTPPPLRTTGSNTTNNCTISNNTSAQCVAPSALPTAPAPGVGGAHDYARDDAQGVDPEGPRPLALISNVTSATGEKSLVIDLC